MISNVIIVHGCNDKDKEKLSQGEQEQNLRHWISWLKNELKKKEIKCFNPLMPKNWNPKYKYWKEEIEKTPVDKNSILIGHSAGGGFWLDCLGKQIKKLRN